MKIFVPIWVVCCSILCAGSIYASNLKENWDVVIRKYPPPIPTHRERANLEMAYAKLIHKYDKNDIQQIKPKISDIRNILNPYKSIIHKASIQFNVPETIITAVIWQESCGNPHAKARFSSAKGLMQTIDATFSMAQKALSEREIIIKNPFSAKDSIIAGTWYLSYVFELAKQDYPQYFDRKNIKLWRKALEYYYAGPYWGKIPESIVYANINGKRVEINKAFYASSVIKYANMM
jgi:Transglycosylase SLT domain